MRPAKRPNRHRGREFIYRMHELLDPDNIEATAKTLSDKRQPEAVTFPPDSYHFLSYIDSVGLASSGWSEAHA